MKVLALLSVLVLPSSLLANVLGEDYVCTGKNADGSHITAEVFVDQNSYCATDNAKYDAAVVLTSTISDYSEKVIFSGSVIDKVNERIIKSSAEVMPGEELEAMSLSINEAGRQATAVLTMISDVNENGIVYSKTILSCELPGHIHVECKK